LKMETEGKTKHPDWKKKKKKKTPKTTRKKTSLFHNVPSKRGVIKAKRTP